jgi:hypothetical protein
VFGAGYWSSSAGLVGWPVCPLAVGWAWSCQGSDVVLVARAGDVCRGHVSSAVGV